MVDQAKAVQAKIEVLISDLSSLDRDIGELENKNKVSEQLHSQAVEKSHSIDIKDAQLKEKIELFEKEKKQLQVTMDSYTHREKRLLYAEDIDKKVKQGLEELKIELAKRELKVVKNEEDKQKLELEKKSFEIIQAKVEKERQLSRDRKEALDERERVIKVKEELLRKRLQG